ncbi:hypothetical protein DYI41_20540 [Marinobacter salarius]|nr:hypothetical protein [Marinobacter salarius]MBS8233300.1 hypothetical protein [Marinobacter salarius]
MAKRTYASMGYRDIRSYQGLPNIEWLIRQLKPAVGFGLQIWREVAWEIASHNGLAAFQQPQYGINVGAAWFQVDEYSFAGQRPPVGGLEIVAARCRTNVMRVLAGMSLTVKHRQFGDESRLVVEHIGKVMNRLKSEARCGGVDIVDDLLLLLAHHIQRCGNPRADVLPGHARLREGETVRENDAGNS